MTFSSSPAAVPGNARKTGPDSVEPQGSGQPAKDPVAETPPGTNSREVFEGAGFVVIHGEIGADGQTPHDLAFALAERSGPVHIRSGGGAFMAGLAMAEQVRKAGRVVIADIASSAAAPILAAGKRRILAANGWMLIHSGWTFVGGRADRLRDHAEYLARMDRAYGGALAKYSGQPLEIVKGWTAAETIMTPEQALRAGLIDEIGPPATLPSRPAQVPNLEADLAHQAASAFAYRPRTEKHLDATAHALAAYREPAFDELIAGGKPVGWPATDQTRAAAAEVARWTDKALIRHHDQGRPLPEGLTPARWRCEECAELNYHPPITPEDLPSTCPFCVLAPSLTPPLDVPIKPVIKPTKP